MRHRDRGQRAHPVGVPGGQRPRHVGAPVVPDDVGTGHVERRHQVRGHLGEVRRRVGGHLVRPGAGGVAQLVGRVGAQPRLGEQRRHRRPRRRGLREAVQQQHRPPVLGSVDPHVEGQVADVDAAAALPACPDASRERPPPPALPSVPVSSPERDFVRAHLDDLHADLDAWLRIPSISADPAHAPDVADSAAWLAEALRRTGFPTVEIWPTAGRAGGLRRVAQRRRRRPGRARLRPPRRPAGRPAGAVGAPAVRADRASTGPTAPSCTPAAPSTTRATSPSTCSACGPTSPPPVATPPPSPSSCSSRARRSPARRTSPRCSASARTGSPATSSSSATPAWPRPTCPSAVTAMRGLADAEITLRGPAVDLHSGSFGGAVPNPLHAMAELLASPARRPGPGHPARLLRQGPPAVRPRARADGPGAVRRAGVARRPGRLPGDRPARPASAPWSGSAPGRPPR